MINLVSAAVDDLDFGLHLVDFKLQDNLAIITGKSSLGKSLVFQIFEYLFHNRDFYSKSICKLPGRVYLHEPDDFVVESVIDDLYRGCNDLILIDDLDLMLNSLQLAYDFDLRRKFLNAILNTNNYVIVVCKRVPVEFKLPDRFFYNLMIKDGIATLEQTLREGLHGVAKNNYVL